MNVFFWMFIGAVFTGIPLGLLADQIDRNFEQQTTRN